MDIDLDELKRGYDAFFNKNTAGQSFINEVTRIIVSNHEKAESKPEFSRDHVQRAAGAREVLKHIQSVLAGVKEVKKN